jgi:hypothetical protein
LNRPCHMAVHHTLSSPAGKLQLSFLRPNEVSNWAVTYQGQKSPCESLISADRKVVLSGGVRTAA